MEDELLALNQMVKAMQSIDSLAQSRAIGYLSSRFGDHIETNLRQITLESYTKLLEQTVKTEKALSEAVVRLRAYEAATTQPPQDPKQA